MRDYIIGFAGLTHLGLNSAVSCAYRGFNTIGYHDDPLLVEKLNDGLPNVLEPQLSEIMAESMDRLNFSSDISCLHDCDLVYIAVDVPTNDTGESNLSSVDNIISKTCAVMNKRAILVILCQVHPGFTRKLNWPKERLYYQVETLIFGRAMDRAINPERYIIGCNDPEKALLPVMADLLGAFNCPILLMKYESAELAKISINMFLVASVSTSNTLAELCEKIGADWFEIVPALRLDKRIGHYAYLTPGLGISGGNLERDLNTILNFSEKFGTEAGVVSAWIENSQYRKKWALHKLQELVLSVNKKPLIGLLGLTYKENTHSIKNSPSIELLMNLKNCIVRAFDPSLPQNLPDLGIKLVDSKEEVLDKVDVLIIMTPWEQFRELSIDEIVNRMTGRIIIDPFRLLNGRELKIKGFTYASLGQSEI
jgi:UDPglucose 6-dehydrogenase